MEALDTHGILISVNAFMGAGLGASFYILLNTQSYLVDRSYDPKYNAVYLARFLTGVIGGVILAIAIGPALGESLGAVKGATLTPGVLAIIGGYAAEAVQAILQRLVDVLLTAVRGDGSSQAAANLATEQAQKNVSVLQMLPDLAASQNDPAKFNAILEKIQAFLKKPA